MDCPGSTLQIQLAREKEAMEQAPVEEPVAVTKLVGVYDADGSLRRELSYWIGARIGRRHCGLCEITHGNIRERKDWRECRDALNIPFETLHRDEASLDVIEATFGRLPAVVAFTADNVVTLLGPEQIEECKGSPVALVDAIRESADRACLSI